MALHRSRAFLARTALLFGFWLLLLQPDSLLPARIGLDWLVGVPGAFAAAWVSLRLLPPAPPGLRLRSWALLRYALRFMVQSLVAGLDVARRALDPRLPLEPGLLHQPTALDGAAHRAVFAALTSQVPGTLAVDLDEPGRLLYHCLDRRQDAAGGLAADEALFREALGIAGATGPEPRA